MVAIFTGAGAGVERGSANLLGSAGQLGGAGIGRGGVNASVNAATGNLVVSRRDEFLVGAGPDASVSRTYNSLGDTADRDNGDGWHQSSTRRIFDVTGAIGVAGSTVKRLGSDGAVITYTFENRGGEDAYWTPDGSGRHDKLIYANDEWTWTDGDSQFIESYAFATGSNAANPAGDNEWRVIEQIDPAGREVLYTYVSGTDLIDKIETDNEEYLQYTWSGQNVVQITTGYEDADTGLDTQLTRAYYEYDSSDRLIKVTVDLSPEDNASVDGEIYEINYTYNDDTNQVRTITQSDGSFLFIAYDAAGRVTLLQEKVADGDFRVTNIGYGTNITSVTDPQGLVTRLWYDAEGRLTQIMSPPTVAGGISLVQQFEYDDDGNLLRSIQTDAENASVPNNLIDASAWGGGELTFLGENLVDDGGWPQDPDTLPLAGTIGNGFTLYEASETQWADTTGPYGQDVAALNTGQSDSDVEGGGAASDSFTIDKSKAYEFSAYVKADQLDKHELFFGLGGGDIVKKGRDDADGGEPEGNPYFLRARPTATHGWSADQWVKIVGYVLPSDTPLEPYGTVGGVYDLATGDKILGAEHFIWNDQTSNAVDTILRLRNFYDPGIQGKHTFWVRPEVRQVADTAILRGDQQLDVDRDAALFTASDWRTAPHAGGEESRWTSVIGADGSRHIALETGQFDGSYFGGGQYTNDFTIDASKAYRFTQYFRKGDLDKHNVYFGPSWSTHFEWAHSGADAINPYFMALDSNAQGANLEEGRWYKVVGYVLEEGAAFVPAGQLGGIYDAETGEKKASVNTFRWSANRPDDVTYARYFNAGDESEHGWTTEWLDPEVVELEPGAVTSDNSDPFLLTYDEIGRTTHFEYDEFGQAVRTIDPEGNATTRTYDANGNLLTETRLGSHANASESGNLASDLAADWSTSHVTSVAVAGTNARRYELTAAGQHGIVTERIQVTAGDTVTYRIALTGDGKISSHRLGLIGEAGLDWEINNPAASSARIISGPGTVTRAFGSLFNIDGISSTLETVVEVTRTFTADTIVDAHFWVGANSSGTLAVGDGITLSTPELTILRRESQQIAPADFAQWNGNNVTVADAGLTLNTKAAQKLTLQTGGSRKSVRTSVVARDEITFDITLQAVGDATSHLIDIQGSQSGLGASSASSASIISGPGTLTQGNGGRWAISGLSATDPTRLQITRRFDQAEFADAILYIDQPNNYRTGSAVLVANAGVYKLSDESRPELTSRYVYDSNNDLRYQITPEGRVTEYRMVLGRLAWEVEYTGETFAIPEGSVASYAPTRAELDAWRDGLADKTEANWTEYAHDARGNLIRTTRYGAASASGAPFGGGSEDYSETLFAYSQAGELLAQWEKGEDGKTQYVYDGVGRVVATSDTSGATSSIYFDDAGTRTIMQLSSGLTRTMVYNLAGELISETDSSLGNITSNLVPDVASFGGPTFARQQVADIAGKPAYRFDAAAGTETRLSHGVDVAAGETVKFRVTLLGSGAQHLHELSLWGTVDLWAVSSPEKSSAVILGGPGQLNQVSGGSWQIDGLSGTQPTIVEITRTFDAAQSVGAYFYVGGRGGPSVNTSVVLSDLAVVKTFDFFAETQNQYDALGRLRISHDMFDGRGPSYIMYDHAGRRTGVVDPSGGLAEYFYDEFSRVTGMVRYYNPVSATVLAQLENPENMLEMSDVRPPLGTGQDYDIREFTTYDAHGQVAQTINGEGEVTSFTYDALGQLVATRIHTNTVAIDSAWYDAPPTSPVVVGQSVEDAVIRNFYDRDGNLVGLLDGEGYLTESVFDGDGRKIQDIAYATKTSADLQSQGTFAELRASADPANAANRAVRYIYNSRDQLRFQVDSENFVTQFTYNRADKLTRTTVHAGALNPAAFDIFDTDHSNWAIETVKAALQANAVQDRVAINHYDSAGRLWRTVDPEGLTTTNYFDYASNVIKTTADDRTMRYWYDTRGNVRFSVDGEGYLTRYQYNDSGQVSHQQIFDQKPQGVSDSTTIQDIAQEATALAATGQFAEVTSQYDAHGRLISTDDAVQIRTTYSYLINGNQASSVWAANSAGSSASSSVFDRAGRVISQSFADGESEATSSTTTYNGRGEQVQIVDGRANATTFTYDKNGRVLTETNAAGGVIAYEYNAFGEVVKVTDPRGAETYTYYDDLGRVEYVRDAEGYVTQTTYNAFGEIASVTRYHNPVSNAASVTTPPVVAADPNEDATTSFTYDRMGRVTQTIDAEDFVESYTYNAFGERISTTAKSEFAAGVANNVANTTTYVYDSRGLMVAEIMPITLDGTQNTSRIGNAYVYDARGNRTEMVEALKLTGSETASDITNILSNQAAFDAAKLPETRHTTYVYDKANRLIETRGQAREVYNQTAHTQLSAAYVPVEKIAYDARGNVIRTEDASGAETYFFYDDLDRKVVEIDALGTYSAYEYDSNGNVTRIRIFETQLAANDIPADGGSQEEAPEASALGLITARETLFEYDSLNRMAKSSVVLPNDYEAGILDETGADPVWTVTTDTSPSTSVTLDTIYQYDANGNVIRTVDPNGNQTFAYYDALGRKTDQVTGVLPEPSSSGGYRTHWDYDSEGNVTQETVYANPVIGAVTTGTIPTVVPEGAQDRITSYTYDEVGNRLSETRHEIVVQDDTDANMDGVLDDPGTTMTVNATVAYTYNGLGQVLTKTEATGDTIAYAYDDGGRLTTETRSSFAGYDGTYTPTVAYQYNGLGNLTRTEASGAANAAARISTYEYNAGGLLSKMTDAEGHVREYFYDTSGRQIVDRYERTLSDGTKVKDSNGSDTYEASLTSYDALGRVVEQKVARWDVNSWQTDTDGDGNAATTDGIVTRTAYNAFGDVIATGTNVNAGPDTSSWQQQNRYDLAGRLWASNAGDGIWKYFGYDKNGNQTIAITSAGEDLTAITSETDLTMSRFAGVTSISASDVNATYTEYDARNMATKVVEEGRELSAGAATQHLTTSRTYNAFGEVATETDARGATLTYTYNTMGRMIRSESPTVEIVEEDGTPKWVKPSEDYYYDRSGRLVALRDANGVYDTGGVEANNGGTSKHLNTGNLTRFELLAGTGYGGSEALITKQINADGGITRTHFDIHGDAREIGVLVTGTEQSGTWRTTTQEFDKIRRLTRVTQPNTLIQDFAYDEVGQRIASGNSLQSTLSGGKYLSGNTETTDYDKTGRVIETNAYGGDVTNMSYHWNGLLEASGTGLVDTGGWVQTTTYANTRSLTESSDAFGRAISKNDLGSNITTYGYDFAGRQTSSQIIESATNGGSIATATYTYLNTGLVDTNTNLNGTATYEYNAAGNRTVEKLEKSGVGTIKDQIATYDLLGRMTFWSELGTPTLPESSKTHSYDANGNIRRTQSDFSELSPDGSIAYVPPTTQWFRYDSQNRLAVYNGKLSGGTITHRALDLGTDQPNPGQEQADMASYSIAYNRAGDRATVTSSYDYVETDYTLYNDDPSNPGHFTRDASKTRIEQYLYNTAGQLIEIWQDESTTYGPLQPPSGSPTPPSTPRVSVSGETAAEGESIRFNISLDAAASSDVVVHYATVNDTADGSDYASASGSVTILTGNTTATVDVGINDDSITEGEERFFFDLTSATGAEIGTGRATGTIEADPTPTPKFSITGHNPAGNEGTWLTFHVSLDAPTTQTVTVAFTTIDGTAQSPADFAAQQGTLTFDPEGDQTQTISISTEQDSIYDDFETFSVQLSNPTGGATIAAGGNSATGTIFDVGSGGTPLSALQGGVIAASPIVTASPGSGSAMSQSSASPSPTGTKLSSFTYDLLGRQVLQEDFNASGNAVYSLTSSYNAKGQLTVSSSSTTRSDGSVVTATTRNDYGSAQDYALGQVVSSTSETALDGVDGDAPDTANRYSFVWYDSAVQGSIEHDKSYSGSTAVGTLSAAFDDDYRTNLAYNAFGQLTSASVNDGLPHSVAFTLDEAGQVIRREETSPGNVTQAGAPHDVWYRFAGAEMGHSGNNGSDNVAAAIARDERIAVPPNPAGTFRGGGQAGTAYADFSGGFEALNSYYQGSRAGTYTVRGGESLQAIAASIYGDANLWYKIAEANGLSGSSALVTGQTLRLPAGVVRSSHNAGTFKPYDPGQTIGELSPTTPKPKKGNNCGVVGAVLVAVVAVAVTAIATAGIGALVTGAKFSTALSSVLGGSLAGLKASAAGAASLGTAGAIGVAASGAAVGSIVSQGVGVATGIQERFNWKGVGLAAISGGITGGLGQNFGSGVGGAAIRGALSSAATQGIGTATGLQDSFSWVGVVAAGVGAGVGRYAGGKWGNSFGAQVAANTAGALANAATRSAINGESFSRNLQAALPDVIGQTLGNAIAGGIAGGGATPRSRAGAPDPASVVDAAQQSTDSAELVTLTEEARAMLGSPVAQDFRESSLETLAGQGTLDLVTRSRAQSVFTILQDTHLAGFASSVDLAGDIVGFGAGRVTERVPQAFQVEVDAFFYAAGGPGTSQELAALVNGLNDRFLPGMRSPRSAADYEPFLEAFVASGGRISTAITYERDATVRELLSGTLLDNSVGAGLFAASGAELLTGITGDQYKVDALRARHGTAFLVGEYGGLAFGVGSLAVGGGKLLLREGIDQAAEIPGYLRRIQDGIDFDRSRAGIYDFDELHIVKPSGSGYYRLDSYNEFGGEIVSRKFTQLSEVQESTALSYLSEISAKYPIGATIGDVPTSRHLGGLELQGRYILEVPAQNNPIPQTVLDFASKQDILIRDADGLVY